MDLQHLRGDRVLLLSAVGPTPAEDWPALHVHHVYCLLIRFYISLRVRPQTTLITVLSK